MNIKFLCMFSFLYFAAWKLLHVCWLFVKSSVNGVWMLVTEKGDLSLLLIGKTYFFANVYSVNHWDWGGMNLMIRKESKFSANSIMFLNVLMEVTVDKFQLSQQSKWIWLYVGCNASSDKYLRLVCSYLAL